MSVTLAQLALHAVAVDSMPELTLRHADEQLLSDFTSAIGTCDSRQRIMSYFTPRRVKLEHGTQGEGDQSMTLAASEEFVYQLLADDTLPLGKTMYLQNLDKSTKNTVGPQGPRGISPRPA